MEDGEIRHWLTYLVRDEMKWDEIRWVTHLFNTYVPAIQRGYCMTEITVLRFFMNCNIDDSSSTLWLPAFSIPIHSTCHSPASQSQSISQRRIDSDSSSSIDLDDDPLLIPPPLRSREPQTNRQAHPKPPPASAITSNQNSTVQPNENGKNPNQKQAEPQAQSQNSGKGKEKGGGKEAPSGGAMSKEVSLNSEKEGDNSIMVGSTSKVASNQVGSEKQNGNQAGTSTSNLSAPLPQTTSTSTPHSLPAQVQVSASPERNEAPISKALNSISRQTRVHRTLLQLQLLL